METWGIYPMTDNTKMERPTCYHCKAVFEHLPDLYKHTTTHTCSLCHQSFCSLKYLTDHIKSHMCTTYNETFADQAELETHMMTHTAATTAQSVDNKLYSCKLCNSTFGTLQDATTHIQTHIQVIKPKSAVKEDPDTKHEMFVKTVPNGEMLSQSWPEVTHALQIQKINNQTCKDKAHSKAMIVTKTLAKLPCSGLAVSMEIYKSHSQQSVQKHQGLCIQRTPVLHNQCQPFQQTALSETNQCPTSLPCTKCNKSFADQAELVKHKVTHTEAITAQGEGEKTIVQLYSCKSCGKRFYTMEDATTHAKMQNIKPKGTAREGTKPQIVTPPPAESQILVCDLDGNSIKSVLPEQLQKCSLCNETFKLSSNLNNHMLSHPNQTTQQVPFPEVHHNDSHHTDQLDCQEQCQALVDLNQHLKEDINVCRTEKSFRCYQCGIGFSKSRSLKKHIMIHTGEKPYTCPHCGKGFTSESSLMEHVMTLTEEKPYKCSHCLKYFTELNSLKTHMLIHKRKKPHTCPYCDKAFTHVYDLHTHMMTHTECPHTNTRNLPMSMHQANLYHTTQISELNSCTKCSKTFADQTELVKHMVTHTEAFTGEGNKTIIRLYSCKSCGKTFCTADDAIRHEKTHKQNIKHKGATKESPNTQNQMQICSHCGKQCQTLDDLKDHLKEHNSLRRRRMATHTQKELKCSHCGKEFTYASTLKRHLVTHTARKKYNCSHCMKSFKQIGHLEAHIRIHPGEKPYRCSLCDKKFGQTNDLKRQMMTHTGEKPYNCSHCSKGFKQVRGLKRHMMTHKKDEPHFCSLCGTQFTNKSNLEQHLSNHENYTDCLTCVKGFLTPTDVEHHLVAHRYRVDMTLCTQTV